MSSRLRHQSCRRSAALVLALVVGLGSLAGCSDDKAPSDKTAIPGAKPGCGILSRAVLDGLTGGAEMETFSGIASKSVRRSVGMTCSLIEKGPGNLGIMVQVNDEADAASAAKTARSIGRIIDRDEVTDYQELPPAGYLCVLDGKVMAAIALPKRSITLTITRDPAAPVTKAAVLRAFRQIDQRLDAYDAEHAS